jgi:hypothetical protein
MLEWTTIISLLSMLQPIRKMKRSLMLLMSITRLLNGFSSLMNGPSFKPAIIMGIKDTFAKNCRKYLTEKANGTLPPPGEKRLTRPAPAFNKYRCEKMQKDPKIKALLSAFSAFTTKYLADSQPAASETAADDDDHDDLASSTEDEDEINAFLGMVGASKELVVVSLVPTITLF